MVHHFQTLNRIKLVSLKLMFYTKNTLKCGGENWQGGRAGPPAFDFFTFFKILTKFIQCYLVTINCNTSLTHHLAELFIINPPGIEIVVKGLFTYSLNETHGPGIYCSKQVSIVFTE